MDKYVEWDDIPVEIQGYFKDKYSREDCMRLSFISCKVVDGHYIILSNADNMNTQYSTDYVYLMTTVYKPVDRDTYIFDSKLLNGSYITTLAGMIADHEAHKGEVKYA